MQEVWVTTALPIRGDQSILAIGGLAALALVLVQIWLVWRVGRLSRSFKRLTTGASGEDLERVLYEHLDRVAAAAVRADEVAATCRDLDRRLVGCVQRVGIVRFDAFEDLGGQLSFALALLDGADNGVVFSSLHGRQETRFFVKPITGGRSEAPLTDEELEALRRAGSEVEAPRLPRLGEAGNHR